MTAENSCFPLVWTISPQLVTHAPQLIEWWYEEVKTTGNDYFVLPPSGDLYSYPGQMSDDDQHFYKDRMQELAKIMNISGTIHWEFPVSGSTWGDALSYFEKYTKDEEKGITGFHCVNVPYFEPILEIFGTKDKKILGDKSKVVLFKSYEWRGVDGKLNAKSPANLADTINGYKAGSVKSVYITSDGGLAMADIFELVGKLDNEKIVIVNQEQLTEMALSAAGE